jgi:hypothetical protein
MDRMETLVSRHQRHWTVAEYQRLAEPGVFEGERVELGALPLGGDRGLGVVRRSRVVLGS